MLRLLTELWPTGEELAGDEHKRAIARSGLLAGRALASLARHLDGIAASSDYLVERGSSRAAA